MCVTVCLEKLKHFGYLFLYVRLKKGKNINFYG